MLAIAILLVGGGYTRHAKESIFSPEEFQNKCRELCIDAESMGALQGISSFCTKSFQLQTNNQNNVKGYCFSINETQQAISAHIPCRAECQYKFIQP